jgi:hypothetical protein
MHFVNPVCNNTTKGYNISVENIDKYIGTGNQKKTRKVYVTNEIVRMREPPIVSKSALTCCNILSHRYLVLC